MASSPSEGAMTGRAQGCRRIKGTGSGRNAMTHRWLWAGLFLAAVPAAAQQQKVGAPPEASNMKLTGWSDLQARSAYQPTIHKQGGRFIAYIGHHGGTDDVPTPVNPMTGQAEPNGTSIVDVTNPAQPKYLRHIPGAPGTYEAGGAQMVRVCDGSALPKGDKSAVYMLRTFGGEAHEIWNVADPSNPKLVTRLDGLRTRTRIGGSATPASASWSAARRTGGPSA